MVCRDLYVGGRRARFWVIDGFGGDAILERMGVQGMGFSVFAILAGVFEMAARTFAAVLLVPEMGYTGAFYITVSQHGFCFIAQPRIGIAFVLRSPSLIKGILAHILISIVHQCLVN